MLYQHTPVLCEAVVDALNIQPSGCYIDGTFGRGGHSQAILERLGPQGRLIALDKDPQAHQQVPEALKTDPRFRLHYACFSTLAKVADYHQAHGQVQGILLDVGVSSPQLDDPARGFSFQRSGPLDMRLDPSRGVSAADWLATVEEQELASVIYQFGEDPYARRIARAIVEARADAPITDTIQLVDIIRSVVPLSKQIPGKNPATQTFQAIRIHLNRELDHLSAALEQAPRVLALGGRLCVITFHSLEDQQVKHFFRLHSEGAVPKYIPLREDQVERSLKIVFKKIKPTNAEIEANPRARSATLRVAERV